MSQQPNHEFDRAAIEAVAHPFDRLCLIMKRLLDPGGCPWDREQTHQSLRQYFIEETYEACEAIDKGDDKSLREELGDVALQIVFHAELAERRGAFRVEDAYEAICTKLLDRHPHVFGTVHAPDADTVLKNWEELKKVEKKKKEEDGKHVSAVSGVPKALPGLQRAGRIQERAARVGFDWDRTEDVAAKVREEVEEFLAHVGKDSSSGPEGKLDEAALEEEFGDLLFALVNMSRFLNIRAEEAMQKASDKFIRRFIGIEKAAEGEGKQLKDMTLAEMDALWEKVKRAEKEKDLKDQRDQKK